MSPISILLPARAGSQDSLGAAGSCLALPRLRPGLMRSFPGVSLEPPWGKGWGVNNSQPPVPFVALFSFDTIKVKLIDSYH